MPGMGAMTEGLGSYGTFMFTKMQNDVYQAIDSSKFVHNRDFMKLLIAELNDDEDCRHLFFKTIFEKLHLSLTSIKAQLFPQAEMNLEVIRALLEFEGAGEAFVNSGNFYTPNINGNQLQKGTYLGKYLSFSALMTETSSWRQTELNIQFHRTQQEQHQKVMDQMSAKFHSLHDQVAAVIKKLMTNGSCKERVLLWMR